MNKILKRNVLPLLLVLAFGFISGGAAQSNREIVKLPPVSDFSLKNGVKFFYIKDDLPRTVVYASVGYGKLYETETTAGTAGLLTGLFSAAGTSEYRGNMLYRALEDVGGEIEFVPGWENITIRIRVLARHTGLAMNILGDVLANPVFSEEGLNTAKSLAVQRIRRNRDNPESRAFSKLREIIFGGKGYGANATEKSIAKIGLKDLQAAWKKYCRGGNINIAVSSSLSAEELKSAARKNLSELPSGERVYYPNNLKEALGHIEEGKRKIYLIPMKLEQATIVTGTVAPPIEYEGNYALYLMNYILGGGSFNSRLMKEIRVRSGLAYSVFSLVRNRYRAGVFMAFAQTRNESVPRVLGLISENIRRISTEQVSSDEMRLAKKAVNNSYIFRFSTPGDIIAQYLDIEYNELDPLYYSNYLKKINRVTGEDILQEGRKIFSPGLITVVAGPENLRKVLSEYGEVIICEQE